MSDHNERACTRCGSLLHHEDSFRCDARFLGVEITSLRERLALAREQAIVGRSRDGVDGVACAICHAWANEDYNLVHVPRCAFAAARE